MSFLSWLFPPRLPGPVRDWEPPADPVAEQGKVLRVYHKLTGIERHFAEVDAERAKPRYFGTNSQYMQQLRNAENQRQQHARDLVAAGYVNTIHGNYILDSLKCRKSLDNQNELCDTFNAEVVQW